MKKKNMIVSIVLMVLSILYTILVRIVDVKDIGPGGSNVGFSTINKYVSDLFDLNMAWYKITEYIGYIAILVAGIYALIGLVELIKRKSIKKIDKEIIALGILYIFVIGIYVLFEKFVINYRPVIIENVLEASYPSSHTLLALCVCGSGIIVNNKLFSNKKYIKLVNIVLLVLMGTIVIGRILSGVHWITDIVGGILISSALLSSYYTVINEE